MKMRKLTDTWFDIMKVIWESTPPVTTQTIMDSLGQTKGWKAQTIITLLMKLVENGFLRTEKQGRLRHWFPVVTREEYLKYEAEHFVGQWKDGSVSGLFAALTDNLNSDELQELEKIIRTKKKDLN